MNLRRSMVRGLAREAQKAGGVTEQRLEAVVPVPGVLAGFLMGTISAEDGQWDVIVHPDKKLYTVRAKGCDETTGVVVQLTEAWVAVVGVKLGKQVRKPADQPSGVCIAVRVGTKVFALSLLDLVTAVLNAPAPAAPEENTDGSQG